MMRSLLSAVASLQAHQARMDIIGNNIANVNTVSYKASKASFQDMLSQTMRGATAGTGTTAGTNPMQIGLGVSLAAVDSNMTQGSLEMTGKSTDLAIQGNGFFMVTDGTHVSYTRDGSFDLDANGYLVNTSSGMRLLGYTPTAAGTIDTSVVPTVSSQLKVPLGASAACATANVTLTGNLSAAAASADKCSSSVNIYDSLGAAHTITLTMTKSSTDLTWDWQATIDVKGTATVVGSSADQGASPLVFDKDGTCKTPSGAIAITSAQLGDSAADIAATLDFSAITQAAGTSSVTASGQDGYGQGTLSSFNISGNGLVTGVFTNGMSRTMGQVALAVFIEGGKNGAEYAVPVAAQIYSYLFHQPEMPLPEYATD